MTDAPKQTWREAQAQRQAEEAEAAFGMTMAEFSVTEALTAARQAFDSGQSLFQVEVPIGWSQGWIGIGNYANRYRADPKPGLLSAVEAMGWRLEHVNTVFVDQGSASTKRAFANAGSTLVAAHGFVLSVYVFRRAGDGS